MDRRSFLRSTAALGGAAALGPSFWQRAFSQPITPTASGPFGPLLHTVTIDGAEVWMPHGFSISKVAESGQPVDGAPGLGPWHVSPDGAATFRTDDGGWVYVCNSEAPVIGGANALRFDAAGQVVDGYPVLRGTSQNCAGGPTPWGTWLSCEEYDFSEYGGPAGMVWECNPLLPGDAVARPALGRFNHEAAAVDPIGRRVYLTEDTGDGLLYRFTPDHWQDDGGAVLLAGTLEAAVGEVPGPVTWAEVPDPSATWGGPTRHQVPGATVFRSGEGAWYDAGVVYVTTKSDRRVWALDTTTDDVTIIYDAVPLGPGDQEVLKVDNVTVAPTGGHVYVAEDSGVRNRLMLLTPGSEGAFSASPFLELVEADTGSELTGPCFSPDGSRLYFSSQRGASIRDGEKDTVGQLGAPSPFNDVVTHRGITYEITGPFPD